MKRIVAVSVVAACMWIGAARADDVELVTGEKLTGTIVERDADKVVIDHPVLGRLTIPSSQLKPPPPPPPPPAWKFKIELGASGSRGNVDQSDLHAAIEAVLDNDERRFKAVGVYTASKTEGVKTKDQTYVEATHDWKFADSPWTIFATGRLDWDKFQDWDRRASVGAGVGYRLVDRDDLKAILRAGLAETREWGGSDPDNDGWRTEGLLGAEASWKVNDTNTIDAKVTYYPDLSNWGEYRVLSSAAWSVKLSKESALSLKIGVEDEFDSHRSAPFEKNDFRYFAALLYEF